MSTLSWCNSFKLVSSTKDPNALSFPDDHIDFSYNKTLTSSACKLATHESSLRVEDLKYVQSESSNEYWKDFSLLVVSITCDLESSAKQKVTY